MKPAEYKALFESSYLGTATEEEVMKAGFIQIELGLHPRLTKESFAHQAEKKHYFPDLKLPDTK